MIIKALRRAYECAKKRNWKKIYWCVDLHGVCFQSSYKKGDYQWINPYVSIILREISKRPETSIIIWSSCHQDDYESICKFFNQHDIKIDFFNENPVIENTLSGNFEKKFYFSVLLDDKAGFDPDIHWLDIYHSFCDADFYERYFGVVNPFKL